ncbi:START-like domain-containing protein [Flavobacteriaceae bacterium]|nr:START-like domain-containing protein [Flavobacteriaceae bacterium]
MSDKKSYSIEYDFHASKQMLFQYLSTPSGLGEWFADNVNSRGESFTFIWDDAEEYAKLLQKKNNERVRFQWSEDEEEGNPYYFEFKIQVDDLTNDVSLIVTDFAEEDELEESKMLWDNLISSLKQTLGSS